MMNNKMSLRKVKGDFNRIFDKTLTDLVRGIRNNKENEAKYIAQCVEEIKEELRHDSLFVKANAISKLTYLQMLGYDISWSAFNVIEVMSSTKFSHKRIGYLAASQCFHENTEVMMLTTNMIRKDLNSQNMYDAGCAMSGLACFVTTDISRDLANDVLTLLNSTKPYLRKKAVLLMYKIFLKFPDALKPAFPRLKEKLEDPDPGVQSAAVNVICELARKNPKNYLPLAPVFFKLMTNSTNNWMLIKIIKLFGVMTKYEPLLGIKLSTPLIALIRSTSAMSLLYECINTVIAVLISISSGLPNHNSSIQLCVQKLRILIEDSDQNLKYLGLLAMSKILKTHPKSVQAHKDLVLGCLDDKDESIRLRALDLLYGMVTKKNLMEIVQRLVRNVTEGVIGVKFRDELILKLVDICAQNDYQYIVNFEWYLSVLIELARVEGGTVHGTLIAQQILDVAIRVDAIRKFATEQMSILLENSSLFLNGSSVSEVLYAAAWICGEFADYLPDQESTLYNLLSIFGFPAHITAVFIQNASKILSKIAASSSADEHFVSLCGELEEMLAPFLRSQNLEIQERATSLGQILSIYKTTVKAQEKGQQNAADVVLLGLNSPTSEVPPTVDSGLNSLVLETTVQTMDFETTGDEAPLENQVVLNGEADLANVGDQLMSPLETEAKPEIIQVEQSEGGAINFEALFYAYPLNPVAAKAQRKVPIPAGLDLEVAFFEEEEENEEEEESDEEEEEEEQLPRFSNHQKKGNRRHKGAIRLVDEPGENGGDGDREGESEELDEREENRRAAASASRRFEQENNPHYLKSKKSAVSSPSTTSSASKKTKKSAKKRVKKSTDVLVNFGEDVNVEEEEEAAEEATDVFASSSLDVFGESPSNNPTNSNRRQTSIPGLVSSDRFLADMRVLSGSGKKKKGKGKKGRKVEVEEEEEEDVTPLKHTIRALEMPEGADLNDEDEGDEDEDLGGGKDPHRALAKVSLEDTYLSLEKSSKKTKTKAKSKPKPDESLLLVGDALEGPKPEKKKKKKTTSSKKVSTTLSDELLITGNGSSVLVETEIVEAKKKKKKKALKVEAVPEEGVQEKKKKAKKSKKSSEVARNRDEYEETLGIEALNVSS